MQPDLLDHDPDTVEREAFTITDDESAAWAIRKLRAAELRITQSQKLYEAEVGRLQHWLREATAGDMGDVAYFTDLLTQYHQLAVQNDPERKTIKLPHGELVSRAKPTVWNFTDDYIEWAEKNAPDTVRVKKEVAKDDAKKVLSERGFADVPGVTVTPGERSYTVKVSK